jgi:hypothetical protein
MRGLCQGIGVIMALGGMILAHGIYFYRKSDAGGRGWPLSYAPSSYERRGCVLWLVGVGLGMAGFAIYLACTSELW